MKSFTVLLISCSCVLLLLPNNEAIILDKLVNIIFPRGTKAPPVAGPTPINIVEPENSAIVDNATEAGEPVGTSAGPPAHSEAASTVQPTDYTTLPSTTESGNDTSKVLITAPASKCPAGQRRNHRGICVSVIVRRASSRDVFSEDRIFGISNTTFCNVCFLHGSTYFFSKWYSSRQYYQSAGARCLRPESETQQCGALQKFMVSFWRLQGREWTTSRGRAAMQRWGAACAAGEGCAQAITLSSLPPSSTPTIFR
ncbi:Protein of unknown function [Gryllus bimaculatus]|nr:Protein of unknown function [Gryllus bimaculatus]